MRSLYRCIHTLRTWHLLLAVATGVLVPNILVPSAYAQEATTLPAPVAAPVIGVAPVVTLSVVPETLTTGQAVLTWTALYALQCVGGGFATGNATSGSMSVSPAVSTTYTITCAGLGGSASSTATLTRTASSGGGGGRSSSIQPSLVVATTGVPNVRWVHTMLTPDELVEAQMHGYGVPYFQYGSITAPIMKVYSAPTFVVLTAGVGSRLQTVHPTFMILKDGVWYPVEATGIWPRESGRFRGKAYYILRPSDPLYASRGKYIADVYLSMPGCVHETCTSVGWRLQSWQL